MRSTHHRGRTFGLAVWALVILGGGYVAIFHGALLARTLHAAAEDSPVLAAAVYLTIGCLRGFTLVPATVLLVAGLPFFEAPRLFALTLLGIVVSSTAIYWFSESLGLAEYFSRKHPAHVDRLTRALGRYELPAIIGWAFLPFAPTDVAGYVCGTLRINFPKYLLGITLGEGTICALYVFLGASAVKWLALAG